MAEGKGLKSNRLWLQVIDFMGHDSSWRSNPDRGPKHRNRIVLLRRQRYTYRSEHATTQLTDIFPTLNRHEPMFLVAAANA
jgi:hypothetical protein